MQIMIHPNMKATERTKRPKMFHLSFQEIDLGVFYVLVRSRICLKKYATTNNILSAVNRQTCFKNMPSHGRILEIGPLRDPPTTERIGIRGKRMSLY